MNLRIVRISRISIIPCLSVLLMLNGLATAWAEEPELQLANVPEFNERYAGNTQVNGQFLSGLSYTASAAKGPLKDLKLGLSHTESTSAVTVCVRLTTDDGRYWAANMYRAPAAFSAPPKVPVPTRYAEQLEVYGPDSLLTLATLAEDCNVTTRNVYVPAIIGSRQENAALLAYVNVSQSKITAELIGADAVVLGTGKCKKPAGGPRVTYSHICEIPLSSAMKGVVLTLDIEVKGLTGSRTKQSYSVHVE
ncbi:hypothetical protein [Agrobacterium vaccinii]|uniref:hypothetical protein n=1 Tax=Agrobacterium vaccinii TaxID=2735528 RepID=UPI001E2948DD|nr:hypothetical protein [Agrobacterium vaccinii]UHS59193.1 hypothetical protein HRS00_20415 [Agrobacterium vaccinii]